MLRVWRACVHCRAFLDEVVREPVELGYSEWGPPPAVMAGRSDTHMGPMGGAGAGGGAAPLGMQAGGGDWAGGNAAQYGGSDGQQQQQYGVAANGNAGQFARAGMGAAAGRYGAGQVPPAASGNNQVCVGRVCMCFFG